MEEEVTDGLEGVIALLAQFLGNRTIAIAVIGVAIVVLTAVAAHLVTKLFRRIASNDEIDLPTNTIFVNIARVIIWCIGLSLLFSACFGVDVTGIVAALGVGGIALSLGLQDTISNVIGGLQISMMKTFQPGDYIRVGSVEGVVHDITWRHACIDGFGGERFVIPNNVINNTTLTVMPPTQKLNVQIDLPYEAVAYYAAQGIDTDGLADLICADIAAALTTPAPEGMGLTLAKDPILWFRNAGEYAHLVKAIVWIAEGEEFERTAAEDAVVRAAAPYICRGR